MTKKARTSVAGLPSPSARSCWASASLRRLASPRIFSSSRTSLWLISSISVLWIVGTLESRSSIVPQSRLPVIV